MKKLKVEVTLILFNVSLLCIYFSSGGALNAMLEYFRVLVLTKTPKMGFQELLGLLTAPVYSPTEATQPASTPYAVHKQVSQ